jgi:hypothetical protein
VLLPAGSHSTGAALISLRQEHLKVNPLWAFANATLRGFGLKAAQRPPHEARRAAEMRCAHRIADGLC